MLTVEAERISDETSMVIEEFAEKIRGHEPYVYVVRKRTDGKCVFLDNNSLCTVYQVRPLVCRFYPFELKDLGNDEYVFAYTRECPCIGNGPELRRSHFEKLFKESARLTEQGDYR